jgi:hypothetical protein
VPARRASAVKRAVIRPPAPSSASSRCFGPADAREPGEQDTGRDRKSTWKSTLKH